MDKYQSPQGNKEDPIIHHPEFIILDGGEEADFHTESSGEQSQYFEAINRLEGQRYPLFLRILFFLMSLGLILAVLFFLLGTLIAVVTGCLTLFRNETILAHLNKTWKTCKKLAAVALGVFVAAFSPPFGLGMILLYFVLHGENIDQGIIGRVFRSGR